jgi:hypothetical protein
MFKPTKKNKKDSVMAKPREMIPMMTQSSDPLGSYTGTPAGFLPTPVGYESLRNEYAAPVQDADDL